MRVALFSWLAACCYGPVAAQELSANKAQSALRNAVRFFDQRVSIEGAYLWRYSSDLAKREGEGVASATTAWVQPPGTPSVGMALLEAYELTGDSQMLNAARRTAYALVRGQLQSGGWDYRIEFEKNRQRYAYRSDGRISGRNTTTLDDDTTQAALTFLIHFDRAAKFGDKKVHAAVLFGLKSLLRAQYPNGAWPQRYSKFPDPKAFPRLKANYPDTWSRFYPKLDYRSYYTFNDNTIADTIEMLFLAAHVYESAEYRSAAEKAGDFIILAQMPEPQPAWAQQYNAKTQPAWARRFEPPAVTGGESQQVLRVLMSLYRHTGNKKYLDPIPKAVRYLRSSLLPDGRLARFYELGTNKPLYFTTKYELTYKDDDLPTHYGFKVSSGLDRIDRDYQALLSKRPSPPQYQLARPTRWSRTLQSRASKVVNALDKRGAWVEKGRLRANKVDDVEVIECRTFINNVRTLAQYINAAARNSQ